MCGGGRCLILRGRWGWLGVEWVGTSSECFVVNLECGLMIVSWVRVSET